MPVPAHLVRGVTVTIHGLVLVILIGNGFLGYRAYRDYMNELMENCGYDIGGMIIGTLAILYAIIVCIRTERLLRRIHETLSCVFDLKLQNIHLH